MSQNASLATRLNGYFQLATPLIQSAQANEIRPDIIPAARLEAILDRARTPLEKLRDARSANIWVTARLGSDEVRVCSVLAKLWDWHHYGSEGRDFLARCLSILGSDSAPGIDELKKGYRVQTEHCLNGVLADRVETVRSVIGIEVKIHAGEGDRQLPRYVQSIARRAALMRRANSQVLFLSPRPPAGDHKSVKWQTWHQVADAAGMADGSTSAGFQIRQFGQFCKNLGT